ncbi:MAG: hypothetical protein IKG58_03205 [Bacilli bacterium]|nr:hypothetical protein [Bacilli bacterium]
MINKIRNYIMDKEFRLTLFKDKLYVINYNKIISLENTNISFKIDKGKIIIKGNDLVLKKLLDKEILVKGKISSIEVKYD